jgi:uncharacterized protein (DUF1810 family)
MSDPFDLERFVQAQRPVADQVRRELSAGRKQSHWMWFVFPQLNGLGHSSMARRYAIASMDEADAYSRHPVLGGRLLEHTALVNAVKDRSVSEIFGDPDDLKFHSCMTLFSRAMPAEPVFQTVLNKYFAGEPDRRTAEILSAVKLGSQPSGR